MDLDVRTTALLSGCVINGLVAGLIGAFSIAVMPGLARLDDTGFVAAMRAINGAILNPVFLLLWTAAPVLAVLGAALTRGSGNGVALAAGAAGLAITTFVLTAVFNIPLNNALDRATDPASARAAFESPWLTWNLVRTLTSTGACALLAAALRITS